ncbi:HlyD family efflux transporter periplasmic adaptor subunit [Streptomyces sp. PR69]|uniref:HlyD family efflux transporter periplasmic adaptor subunit n=1 Tax=Streptomyces sp. PR69 TaxID=2984950 RepID=UPI002263B90E|nr:HlyD family efflux transporter periplasmic adaptor subunit [Streptomyces sp. PR69]
MQFRQKALAKLQSPEDTELPVRFARPQGWLVLTVTVAAMTAALLWAMYGSVSSTVKVPGILTYGQGSYVLQSPVAGQITEVLAEEGERLPAGAPLLTVRTDGSRAPASDNDDGEGDGTGTGTGTGAGHADRTVRTIAAGRLTSLVATIGAVVTTGANVAVVEVVDDADAPLRAMLYLPGGSGPPVSVGARVDLTVQSVPAQRYGVLRGRVASIGRTAQTQRQITAFLGDSQLGEEFSRQGRPVPVLVELERSDAGASGYVWSSDGAPPYALASMTPAVGSVHLAEQRPVDWLLP